jgi:FKBP-type peptidyl-prolyl cis-trans isomerase SlyD
MEALNNRIVGLTYVLRDGDGQELERRDDEEPFFYLQGQSNIIPGLESTVSGMEEGDEFDVEFDPEDAYGEYNSNLIQRVAREEFPDDMELKPGMPIQLVPEGGGSGMVFYIKEVAGDEVVLDGNPPLAGKKLHFVGQVIEVREATEEEIDHGHAHVGEDHHH